MKEGSKETKRIIDDLTLTIPDDTFTVITGPNGGGKSTLAKLIMGIESPTSGQILLDGEDITKYAVPPTFRRITVSEAAALQGFPPGFTFCGSRCEQYRQIGNSVPPPFAYHIAKSVAKSISQAVR